MAEELKKTFIIYFGLSGHGKWLVDAMGCFGAKSPLRKTIITLNKYFSKSEDIVEYLEECMVEKDNWYYILIENNVLSDERKSTEGLPLNGCKKMHMISFLPNGTVVGKENLCSCDDCLIGIFHKCQIEKGKIYKRNNDADDSSDEYEDDEGNSDDEYEDNEIPKSSILDDVEKGTYIAIYSHSNASELFYICKALDKATVSTSCVYDDWKYPVNEGLKYVPCHYLEKQLPTKKRTSMQYKLLDKKTVLAEQIFYPCVPINDDLSLPIGDYQLLGDMR